MKNLNKIALVVSKIGEVCHWVGVGFMAAAAVLSVVKKEWLSLVLVKEELEIDSSISVYGFDAVLTDSSGNLYEKAVLIFSIGAVIILSLMAMTFRNVYLILKKSENSTPFQKDNIRMLKEIGIFSISIPIVGLIMSAVFRIVVGVETAEVSMSVDGFFVGIVMLCLTQVFSHGAELEEDVSGLL